MVSITHHFMLKSIAILDVCPWPQDRAAFAEQSCGAAGKDFNHCPGVLVWAISSGRAHMDCNPVLLSDLQKLMDSLLQA